MKEEYSGKFKKIWKSSVFMSFSIVKAKKKCYEQFGISVLKDCKVLFRTSIFT